MKSFRSQANPFLKGLAPAERAKHIDGLQKASPGAAQNSLLLRLPAELRNRIYELVLVINGHLEVDPNFDAHAPFPFPGEASELRMIEVIKEPALLRSCSEIRTEATEMYYTQNTFICCDRDKLLRWVTNLDVKRQKMLGDIRIARTYTMRSELARVYVDVELLRLELNKSGARVGTDALRFYLVYYCPVEHLTWIQLKARLVRRHSERWGLVKRQPMQSLT